MINRKIFFILILGLVFFYSYTISQPKIRIILHQPPPNQMGVGDLWNMELTNITKENVNIYLKGTATEEKDGLIVEGTSKVFTVKPGTTKYKYSDFSNAEVKYNNGKYKEIILRTGNAPEGSYTVCVTAFEETGDIAGQENCIIQSVKQLGSISLISPEDGAEINPEQPIIFNWTPLPKGGPYTLRIVELKGSQSPDDAFRSNQAIFEKELRTTTYQGDPIHGVDVKLGLKYAWQVKSGDVESEIYVFAMFNLNTGSNDCVFSDNYDNSTNVNDPWNIVTSNSTLITSSNDINPCLGKTTSRSDNRISVSGGFCKFNNADEDGVDYRVWKNINTTLDNSWQADFEFSYNESGLGLDNRCGHPIFALTSGTDNPINTGSNKMCNFSNQDAIMVWMWQPTALYYNNRGETVPPAIQRVVGLTPWCKKGKDLDTYTPHDIFPILPNTFPTYYIRLERLNSTQGRLSVYSDAARTQRIMSSENKPYICFDIPPGLQNLNILQHSNAPHGSGRILTGKIDNTCIKDISDGIISDCGQQSPNCLGCQIITANISTFKNSRIQLRAYVGQNVGNINPLFEDPQPDNFNNWPNQPIAPSISTLTNTRYVIKASGGLPDQWGRVYDAAYQLSGTWGNPTLPSCQGFAQFMLVNSNLFTLGKRPNYPNNLYNSAYHEYLYEFQTPSFPTGNITYSNINNVGGGSGNIQASYNFYMLCDTNNFKFVWKLIEGNHSDVTFSNENSSSPFFKATGQGQYTYELSIYCKSNNQLVDKDTSRIFVYPNTIAYLNNNQYVYPTPTTTCGCGCWNSISVGTSSGGPFNLIQHGGIVQVQQSTTDIYFKSSYSYVPTPSSLTNSLYCWVYKKNDINDVSWGTPIWEGYIINNPSTPNSLNLNSNITGNYYWVRINPQVPPSISPDYSCTERNFYLQIIP